MRLWIGLILLPLVFAWFTLRKGYRAWVRILAFVWLLLSIPVLFVAVVTTPMFFEDAETRSRKYGDWHLAKAEEGQFDDRRSILIRVTDEKRILESTAEALRFGREVSPNFYRVRAQIYLYTPAPDNDDVIASEGFRDAIELTWTEEDLARFDADPTLATAINLAQLTVLHPLGDRFVGEWCLSERSEGSPAFCARRASQQAAQSIRRGPGG